MKFRNSLPNSEEGPISHQSRWQAPAWLPADLRRALRAIAAAEEMTVPDLVATVLDEFIAYYRKPEAASPRVGHSRPQDAEALETVWTPHRDAPSLLGMRESKTR